MNHTPSSLSQTSDKAAYLYWNDVAGTTKEDKSVGPAIALHVGPGDKISFETWPRFERKTSYSNFEVATLASLVGGTIHPMIGFDGYTLPETVSNVQAALVAAGFDDDDTNGPHAYLNYIIYNENMVYQSADRIPVPDDAGSEPNEINLPLAEEDWVRMAFDGITIQNKGYIYIWVSNESPLTHVWFDDLKVTQVQNIVVQAADYGVWGDVIREQNTDETIYNYRFGYQGQFSEKDAETGWNHFELREYDPIVGRWTAVDPKRQFFSPYVGMGNNPISGVDPDGAFKKEFGANWYAFWHGGGDVEQSLGGANKGEWYVGNQVDYKGDGVGVAYQRSFDYGNGNKSFGEHVWNHPVTRGITGDYVFISVDLNIFVVGGVKESPIGYVMALRGPDAFQRHSFIDTGYGLGLDVSGSFNWGKSWVLSTDVEEVTISNFAGKRAQLNLGVGPVGVGRTYSPPAEGANHFGVISKSYGLGMGATFFSGNINYGETLITD